MCPARSFMILTNSSVKLSARSETELKSARDRYISVAAAMGNRLNVIVPILVFALTVAGIGGYFYLNSPPKNTGPVERVTVATVTAPDAGILYIASLNDYFKNEGLDVSIELYESGRAARDGLFEGKVDLAVLGDIPFMFAVMRGENISIIATIQSSDETLGVVARKDTGISTASDLGDKTIGVTLGTGGEFFLDAILASGAVLRDTVEIVDIKPAEIAEALINGEVDAVSTWQPIVIELQARLGESGFTLTGENIHRETINLAARRDYIDRNPAIIKKLLKATMKAEQFIRENPDESIDMIANFIDMDKGSLMRLWDIYELEVTLDQSLLSTLEDESRWAIKNALTDVTEVPNYLEFIYQDGLDAVNPDAVGIIR